MADSGRCYSWLTICGLSGGRGTTATSSIDSLDVYLVALVTLFIGVDVVELSAQTLPPDDGATEAEGIVGTQGETRGIDGSGLGRGIELELIIGSNIASPISLIFENASGESEGEDAIELSLRSKSGNIQADVGVGAYLDLCRVGADVHDLDLEGSGGIWLATLGRARGRRDGFGDSLRCRSGED